MIIRLEPMNASPPRIIEVYADDDRVLLRILDRHAFIKRNENIRGTGHHCFQLGFPQLAIETLGNIESNQLLCWTRASICAAIFAAVSGIYDHGLKGFAGIFNRSMP